MIPRTGLKGPWRMQQLGTGEQETLQETTMDLGSWFSDFTRPRHWAFAVSILAELLFAHRRLFAG